jgi:hypothetical protein
VVEAMDGRMAMIERDSLAVDMADRSTLIEASVVTAYRGRAHAGHAAAMKQTLASWIGVCDR